MVVMDGINGGSVLTFVVIYSTTIGRLYLMHVGAGGDCPKSNFEPVHYRRLEPNDGRRQ
jgi:hypothetical protein